MSDTSTGHHGAERFEIRLKGQLEPRWAAWFDGLSPTDHSDGTTVTSGPVAGQAACVYLVVKGLKPSAITAGMTATDTHPAPARHRLTRRQQGRRGRCSRRSTAHWMLLAHP